MPIIIKIKINYFFMQLFKYLLFELNNKSVLFMPRRIDHQALYTERRGRGAVIAEFCNIQ